MVIDELRQDIRYAFRTLRRAPGFVIAVVVTLALGIGATTAVFSVVNGVLLRDLPFPDADRVMVVRQTDKTGTKFNHSAANFLDLERDVKSFQAVAGYREDAFSLHAASGELARVDGAQVTPGFFDVFGVKAQAGRVFDAATARENPGQLLVLSDGAWRRTFGADPGVIGRKVSVSGSPYTIVAIMPAGFQWPDNPDVWVNSRLGVPSSPIQSDSDVVTNRGLGYFNAIARIRTGVTRAAVETELSNEAHRLQTIAPQNNEGLSYRLLSARESLVGDVRTGLFMLLGAVAFVLIIAAVNVANLLLARASARQREFVVRAAIGAGQGRLMRQLAVESQVLALLGGALGIGLAVLGTRVISRLAPMGLPRASEVGVDGMVLLFALGVSVVTGLVFGLSPALSARRTNLAEALRSGARSGTHERAGRLRSALVTVEIALAVVVLVGAGLLGSSLMRLQRVDPGFDAAGVVAIDMPLGGAQYQDAPAQRRFYEQLRADLAAAHPRWTVALGFPLPFEGGAGSSSTTSLEVETNKNREQLDALIGLVSEDYFKTLGVPLESGREVGSQDRADGARVAVVNAAFAKRWWPAREAVGQEFSAGFGKRITVIGVVGDSRSRKLDKPPEPMFYLPYRQLALPYLTLLIRTSDGLGDVVRQVRSAVKTIDPNQPIGEARPFSETIDRAVAAPRFRTSLLGGFAALALLLGAVGIYGLLSYLVTIGRREVGIQLALGATPGRVVWRTTWRGLRLALIGIVVGLVGSVVLTRFLAGFLYEVRPMDPATLAVVSAVLALVALAASYIPARRAAAVDPAISLRAEA